MTAYFFLVLSMQLIKSLSMTKFQSENPSIPATTDLRTDCEALRTILAGVEFVGVVASLVGVTTGSFILA